MTSAPPFPTHEEVGQRHSDRRSPHSRCQGCSFHCCTGKIELVRRYPPPLGGKSAPPILGDGSGDRGQRDVLGTMPDPAGEGRQRTSVHRKIGAFSSAAAKMSGLTGPPSGVIVIDHLTDVPRTPLGGHGIVFRYPRRQFPEQHLALVRRVDAHPQNMVPAPAPLDPIRDKGDSSGVDFEEPVLQRGRRMLLERNRRHRSPSLRPAIALRHTLATHSMQDNDTATAHQGPACPDTGKWSRIAEGSSPRPRRLTPQSAAMDGQSCHGTRCVDAGGPPRGCRGAGRDTAAPQWGARCATLRRAHGGARDRGGDPRVRRRTCRRSRGVLGSCGARVGGRVGRCGRHRGRGIHHPRRRIGELSARGSRSEAGVAEGRHALPASVDDLGAGDLARRSVRNAPVDAVPCSVADLARSCRRHADGDHDRRPRGRRLRLHRVHARRTCHRDPARAAAVRRRGDRVHGECRDDARRRLVPAPLQRARRSRAASRRRSSTPRSSWRVV